MTEELETEVVGHNCRVCAVVSEMTRERLNALSKKTGRPARDLARDAIVLYLLLKE